MTDTLHLAGACAAVATMHAKDATIERALAPTGLLFTDAPAGFDTDRFGTFTREIARAGTQLEAARRKAHALLAAMPGLDVAIASEGVFGPHPACPWLPGGHEIVLLLDRRTGIEVVGTDRTTQTNFAQRRVASLAQAEAFAATVGLPHHGIVVMPAADRPPIAKGLTSLDELRPVVAAQLAAEGMAWLETDMRAHRNLLRMVSIGRAAAALATACLDHGRVPRGAVSPEAIGAK